MQDLTQWLSGLGLEEYAPLLEENRVGLDVLPELTAEDLKDLGIPLGDRKRLLRGIASLEAGEQAPPGPPAPPAPAAKSPERPAPGAVAVKTEFGHDAERRQLTVMFCDMAGSTALSTRMDPEDLLAVIRQFQHACVGVIHRFDGLVARYMGDGVLAYFGYPTAHEDDAERAIHAALGIVQAVADLRESSRAPVQVRVGIATGPVIVGELIGSGEAQEREVLGETPNLAARLQSLAEPGSVLVGDSTRRLAGKNFDYADLGPQTLKGFDEPVRAWQVMAESRVETRFEAHHASDLIPLVGREHEVALLRERWGRAKAGEPQTVLLSGEAGIGKSRIIEAVCEVVAAEPHERLRYQCSPYHTDSALYPVLTQIERAAGLERDDAASVKLDKLERQLETMTERVEETAAALARAMSIPAEDRYAGLDVTPQRQKTLIFEAWVGQVRRLGVHQPVLVIFEDTHWIDPTSEELVLQALGQLGDARVLILVSHRPEYRAPWLHLASVTSLALSRVSRRQGAEIAMQRTGGKALPPEVLEHIIVKSEGNPLYVEELTKTLVESRWLRDTGEAYELTGALPAFAIPATLHDSLIARLDRLAPVKQLAQIGAAIGREFEYEVIAAVSALPDNVLGDALSQLVEAELLLCAGAPPESRYTFKHALMQDAAYSSLLNAQRQRLHAQIAAVLESSFPALLEIRPELLAYHLTEAGDLQSAMRWWRKAGERAVTQSANVEASRHFSRALELLARLPATEDTPGLELDLQLARGQALIATQGFAAPGVKAAYTRARELSEQIGDLSQSSRVLVGLWNFYMVKGEHAVARELAEKRYALALGAEDQRMQSGSHQNLGASLYQLGEFGPALEHLEQGMALFERIRQDTPALGSFNVRVGCLCYAAYARWALGYPDTALALGMEMLELAEEQAHPFSIAFARFVLARLHQFRREPDAVRAQAEKLLALSTAQEFSYRIAQGKLLKGWALVQLDEPDDGLSLLREGLDASRATGAEGMGPYYLALLGESYGHCGDLERGSRALQDARALAAKTGERNFEPEILRLMGELLLRRAAPGDEAEGEACLRESVALAVSQRARSFELRSATSLAHFLARRGDPASARDALEAVYSGLGEGLVTPDGIRARATLAELA